MDLRTAVIYFMVFFCGSLVLFTCKFGSLLMKVQRLILDDSTDLEDIKIRSSFVYTLRITFITFMLLLFTEVVLLTLTAVLNFK